MKTALLIGAASVAMFTTISPAAAQTAPVAKPPGEVAYAQFDVAIDSATANVGDVFHLTTIAPPTSATSEIARGCAASASFRTRRTRVAAKAGS